MRDIEKKFEYVRGEVKEYLERAKRCTTYAAVLFNKAKAEERWSFIWMMAGEIDEENNEKFRKEWEEYNKEFKKILATK